LCVNAQQIEANPGLRRAEVGACSILVNELQKLKLCRFNHDRLGVIVDGRVTDITMLFDLHPVWPLPPGDWIVSQLAGVMPRIREHARSAPSVPIAAVRLESPIANPGKIVGAPINYKAHLDEARSDPAVAHGRALTDLSHYGLFIKATSALIGPSDAVRLRFPERRNDHEVELAVVIGKTANQVDRKSALDYVAGYSVGLDMTLRGAELPTFRKSVDTYMVLGPWMVTAEEIPDPNTLQIGLKVNGAQRQLSNTSHLIYNVQHLIEYASSFYTLHPGDIIMTGTPEGVSQVCPGDAMEAYIERVGTMNINITSTWGAS
jgi:2-keto-4-pentenoate hydratase/2-oxohepta-3-ene-1,7-dioic acid hydratase in catechol pathway